MKYNYCHICSSRQQLMETTMFSLLSPVAYMMRYKHEGLPHGDRPALHVAARGIVLEGIQADILFVFEARDLHVVWLSRSTTSPGEPYHPCLLPSPALVLPSFH